LDIPERINKLILISTTPSFIQHEDWIWAMEEATLKLFIKNLNQDYTSTLNRFFTLQISGDVNTLLLLRQLRKNVFREGMPDKNGLEIGMQILLTTDLRRSIKNINQPVTVVHGECDVIVPPNAARWLDENLQDSRLVMLPDCGHIPFLSHADQFLNSIFQAARI
jgi:pimeloyl-[acyl-carrier protein] methyl ester esterase